MIVICKKYFATKQNPNKVNLTSVRGFQVNKNFYIIANVNNLTNKRQAFELFLCTLIIHLMLPSKTRLKATSYVNFHGFPKYAADHPSDNSHGGTAITMKYSIKHFELLRHCKKNSSR